MMTMMKMMLILKNHENNIKPFLSVPELFEVF